MRNASFREELKVTKNEKTVICCWFVFFLVSILGQMAYWLGLNVPIGYVIYDLETGNTGGLFILVMFFWPMFGVYKIAKAEEKLIRHRKCSSDERRTNFEA